MLAIALVSCETTQDANDTTLTGKVYYIDNNYNPVPVEGSLVYAQSFYGQTTTDATGAYSLLFETELDELEVRLVASKAGFNSGEVSIFAKKGEEVFVPDITLVRQQVDTTIIPIDTVSTSGDGAHIEVYSKPVSHIYIHTSGLKETSTLTFLVTDAQGKPVDDEHKVDVEFSILNGPDGGEYIFPESMETQDGYVYTTLNSGVLAGVVQVEAKFTVDSETIRALPIRVAIYGGLPDEEHFSVALEKVNIAGRVHSGLLDKVTAFVGDKFSNPVAPGTAVYFYSDYGIVDGSAVTDGMGRATVEFMSAAPIPPQPLINPFANIKAQTYTDTLRQKTIETDVNLLLTGVTDNIQIAPTSFTYTEQNTPVQFNYVVQDVYGYPLVGETQIQVSATDGALYGDVSIRMVDTQVSGPGSTDFSFAWAPGDSLEAPQVYITITVNPPADGNGYRSTSVSGTKTSN